MSICLICLGEGIGGVCDDCLEALRRWMEGVGEDEEEEEAG